MGLGLLSLASFGVHKDNGVFLHKQMLNIAIGLIPATAFATIPPRTWIKAAPWLYGINILCLVAIFRVGAQINGSARWIEIAHIRFEPSEMAKLVTILTLASFYAMRQDKIKDLSTFLLGLLHVGVPMILILKQPHVGGALVILAIWAAISLVSNVPIRYIAVTGALFGLLVVGLFAFPKVFFGSQDYHSTRFLTLGTDMQTDAAREAFGVGGVSGTGFAKGEQGSMIPEQQTDFIFTIPGEELGLIGCTLALATFGLLFYRIWLVMLHAEDVFCRMIVTGILGVLAFHTFVNLFMITQMLPVIGLWLPFMSYGGTAMWLCMSGVALVMNIRSRESPILF